MLNLLLALAAAPVVFNDKHDSPALRKSWNKTKNKMGTFDPKKPNKKRS
jgi:hypothetical protein